MFSLACLFTQSVSNEVVWSTLPRKEELSQFEKKLATDPGRTRPSGSQLFLDEKSWN